MRPSGILDIFSCRCDASLPAADALVTLVTDRLQQVPPALSMMIRQVAKAVPDGHCTFGTKDAYGHTHNVSFWRVQFPADLPGMRLELKGGNLAVQTSLRLRSWDELADHSEALGATELAALYRREALPATTTSVAAAAYELPDSSAEALGLAESAKRESAVNMRLIEDGVWSSDTPGLWNSEPSVPTHEAQITQLRLVRGRWKALTLNVKKERYQCAPRESRANGPAPGSPR